MGNVIQDDDIRDDAHERLKARVVGDIESIRQIKITLLKLAANREDTELAEIANRIHIARCEIANTITVILGLWSMASQTSGQKENSILAFDDCGETQ
jgi:hypothetical protein